MLDNRTNKIVLATFGIMLVLILGNIIVDFKVFDAIYIFAFIVYIIRYKLDHNVE